MARLGSLHRGDDSIRNGGKINLLDVICCQGGHEIPPNHSAKQGSQSNEDEGKPGGGMGQREAEKTKKRDRR